MKIVPTSQAGKLSGVFIVAMFILFIVGTAAVGRYDGMDAGKSIIDDITQRPFVSIPMLGGFVAAAISFFSGMHGIFRNQDRSLVTIVATVISGLLCILLLGELLFS